MNVCRRIKGLSVVMLAVLALLLPVHSVSAQTDTPGVSGALGAMALPITAANPTPSIALSWNVSTFATSYNVYRGTSKAGESNAALASGLTTTHYIDSGLIDSVTYYYRVAAVNPGGTSPPSNEASASPIRPTSIVTFIKSDTTTKGSWKGVYGDDGYNVVNDTSTDNPKYPTYATVSTTASAYTWAATTNDAQGLTLAANGATSRILASWYNAKSFTIDCNVTDGNTHNVALYCLDWNSGATRSETIEIVDVASGEIMNTQSVSAFSNGTWEVWAIKGHVKLVVTDKSGGNCVASGIFFSTNATAIFEKTDSTTHGTWKSIYGDDGYNVVNDKSTNNPKYPAYAAVSTTASPYTWAATTSDIQGLTLAANDAASRILACWYNAKSYTIDCNLTDGSAHSVELYCLDWDSAVPRIETVQVEDADTSAILNAQTVSGFSNGIWKVWSVTGHVKFVVTDIAGGNCVVSGIFFR